MFAALLLWADGQTPPDGAGGGPGAWSFLPFVLIAVFFYLLLIRPGQKQEKQRQALVAALKRNDRIVNQGGIIGIVESVKEKEDEVVLKGGLRVTKSSIVRVLGAEDGAKE